MKILKFKKEQFDTNDAQKLVLDLEAELGVNLMNHNSKKPNNVHGYVNTSSDGDVEVYLYEQEDINDIVALPDEHEEVIEIEDKDKKKKVKRKYKLKALSNNRYKKCNLTDTIIKTKCDNFFNGKGFKKHPDMKDKDMIRQNRMGQDLWLIYTN